MHVLTDDVMRFFRRIGDVAGDLGVVVGHAPGAKTEGRGIGIPRLHLETGPVDGAAVETWGGTRLQPTAAQAELLERFA